MVTMSQLDQLKEAGAIESAVLILKRHDCYGRERTALFTEIQHFFNESGDEIGYVSTLQPDNILWFNPPRCWDPKFKESYEFTQLH